MKMDSYNNPGPSIVLLLLQGPLPSREQPATAFNESEAEPAPPKEELCSILAQESTSAFSPVPQAYSLRSSGESGGSHSGSDNGSVVVIKPSQQQGGSGASADSGANVGSVSGSNGSLTAAFAASTSSGTKHMDATEHSSEALLPDLVPGSSADRAGSGETCWMANVAIKGIIANSPGEHPCL